MSLACEGEDFTTNGALFGTKAGVLGFEERRLPIEGIAFALGCIARADELLEP